MFDNWKRGRTQKSLGSPDLVNQPRLSRFEKF